MVVPYTALLRVVGIIVILFFINWKLAVAITILIPPILVIHMLLFRRLRPMWRNIQDDRSLLSARLTDMYGGIRVVRSFKRERSELKEFGAVARHHDPQTAIHGSARTPAWHRLERLWAGDCGRHHLVRRARWCCTNK